MADPIKLAKSDKTLFVDDGENRGPMTVKRVRFHPTRPFVMAQVVDRRLAMWDIEAEPQELKRKKGKFVVGQLVTPHDAGWVRGFDVHPKGGSVVTAGSDRRLKLWRFAAEAFDTKPMADVAGHDGWCEAASFSPDGSRIATGGGRDFVIRIWDGASLKPVKTIVGHANYLRDVIWSRDGKHIISGAEDGKILVIDSSSYKTVQTITFGETNDQQGQNPKYSGVYRLAISSDDRFLAVAGGQRTRVYDLEKGVPVAEAQRVSSQAVFHHSAAIFAAGESELKVWRYESGKLVPPKPDNKGKPGRVGDVPGKSIGSIKRGEYSQGLAFSPDGNTLAAGKSDGSVELWGLV